MSVSLNLEEKVHGKEKHGRQMSDTLCRQNKMKVTIDHNDNLLYFAYI
jgi:hypothetical protein